MTFNYTTDTDQVGADYFAGHVFGGIERKLMLSVESYHRGRATLSEWLVNDNGAGDWWIVRSVPPERLQRCLTA